MDRIGCVKYVDSDDESFGIGSDPDFSGSALFSRDNENDVWLFGIGSDFSTFSSVRPFDISDNENYPLTKTHSNPVSQQRRVVCHTNESNLNSNKKYLNKLISGDSDLSNRARINFVDEDSEGEVVNMIFDDSDGDTPCATTSADPVNEVVGQTFFNENENTGDQVQSTSDSASDMIIINESDVNTNGAVFHTHDQDAKSDSSEGYIQYGVLKIGEQKEMGIQFVMGSEKNESGTCLDVRQKFSASTVLSDFHSLILLRSNIEIERIHIHIPVTSAIQYINQFEKDVPLESHWSFLCKGVAFITLLLKSESNSVHKELKSLVSFDGFNKYMTTELGATYGKYWLKIQDLCWIAKIGGNRLEDRIGYESWDLPL